MEVPEVDPIELRKAWQLHAEATWNRPDVQVGFEAMKSVCSPGVDAKAVVARVGFLDKLVQEAVRKAAAEKFEYPFAFSLF